MNLHSQLKKTDTATVFATICGYLITAHLACGQPPQLEVLANFNGTNGANPYAALTLGSDGNFYGTTSDGGAYTNQNGYGYGTVFRVTTNGVLTTLTSFAGTNGALPNGLTLGSDGNFYGTTLHGGAYTNQIGYGYGTVFRVTTNGVLTTLTSFAGTNGTLPSGLTLGSDGNFYGTVVYDYNNYGTLFRVTTNGVLTILASFAETNGVYPNGLTLGSDGNFYGTTSEGGSPYNTVAGSVFRVTTNGAITDLYCFPYDYYHDLLGGPDSAGPVFPSGLTLGSDGRFYGTTAGGNIVGDTYDYYYDGGTVFQVTTNGVLTTLHFFEAIVDTNGNVFSTAPGKLTLGSDGNFYGMTGSGGTSNYGTVCQVTTNGVFTALLSFAGTNRPNDWAGLTLGSDGNFYSTGYYGGNYNLGVIYRLRHGAYLQSFGITTNGFQLNTLNVGGSGWVVLESSSDLAHWTPIQTNGTAAAQQFLDPTALAQPHQFYRVRQQ
jgi:uncharacterized repeat protein (TIGR03803 family)